MSDKLSGDGGALGRHSRTGTNSRSATTGDLAQMAAVTTYARNEQVSDSVLRVTRRRGSSTILSTETDRFGCSSGSSVSTDVDPGSSEQGPRALRVPYREDNNGLSRLTTVNRSCCSTALSWPGHVVPKLLINTRASGGPRLRDNLRTAYETGGHQGSGHTVASSPEA
jgi:hypothetical protein